MADNIERGRDKQRVIEQAGGASLVTVLPEALAKTDRGDQEQGRQEQIPRTGQQVRGVRDGRGRCGQKRGAGHVGRQGDNQQRCGRFLAGLPGGGHVSLDGDGGKQQNGKQGTAHHPTHRDSRERQGARDQRAI